MMVYGVKKNYKLSIKCLRAPAIEMDNNMVFTGVSAHTLRPVHTATK